MEAARSDRRDFGSERSADRTEAPMSAVSWVAILAGAFVAASTTLILVAIPFAVAAAICHRARADVSGVEG
jgi:hypothetical protein